MKEPKNISRRGFVATATTTGAAALLTRTALASAPSAFVKDDKSGAVANTITVQDGTTIYYKDWGTGQPLVFHHGWPLSADAWDAQMLFFLQHGFRVIAHDRRGHGRSTQTVTGNDMDTYAADVAALVESSICVTQFISDTRPVVARSHVTLRSLEKGVSPRLC